MQRTSVRLTIVAAICVGRLPGSDANRVAFGLISSVSSGMVIVGEQLALKSCRTFGKGLNLEKGLEATGFRTTTFS